MAGGAGHEGGFARLHQFGFCGFVSEGKRGNSNSKGKIDREFHIGV
jgi:hypothetical protein